MTSGLLLDTHALLFALGDPASLGDTARARLTDRETDVHVSAASVWEIATKGRLGKLPGAVVLLSRLDAHLARLGSRDLPVTRTHAQVAGLLDWEHRDPFDRMLVAQASVEDLIIVTRDRAITEHPGTRTLW